MSPQERELAAKCALVVARLFAIHGWKWSDFHPNPDYVPDVEAIAQTIELCIEGRVGTGRIHVEQSDIGLEVFLHLGGIYEGEVSVDTDLIAGGRDGD